MVEMKVYGLALDETTQVPILILKDIEKKRVLPIWIGALEAVAISLVLNDVELPRPMTHDLLLNGLSLMDCTVEKVAVVDLKDGTYFAEITMSKEGKTVTLDSRPSDAVALALRAKVPIFASTKVLDMVISEGKGEYQVVLDGDDEKKWADMLEKLSLDDIKYKM